LRLRGLDRPPPATHGPAGGLELERHPARGQRPTAQAAAEARGPNARALGDTCLVIRARVFSVTSDFAVRPGSPGKNKLAALRISFARRSS
jgi:hypothetical protein